ncbi:helix-turn-helix domain-containing protein [Paraburkholderia sp. HP33-1]|uniref:helix-turn-helix domain-containing protein n=1 Tax=Paraburkholderia sp. HP33-1 TaxID=2883243 RepID=UPI001F17EAC1|nr:helix-turn-helix transcriptional regulator [Paraburkholderia sp. HP33-1]
MVTSQTLDELGIDLGEKLKRLRLNKNLDQKTLAARAGVSVRALRNIEAGQGSTVKTLLSVVRALGRESWLDTVAPVATVNPLTLTSRVMTRGAVSNFVFKAYDAPQENICLANRKPRRQTCRRFPPNCLSSSAMAR